MEKISVNKVNKIEQILPDYITGEIILKKCLCVKVPKRETSKILAHFKKNNLIIDKVYLQGINYHTLNYSKDYQRPLKDNDNNDYQEYDGSFLKRVKNYSEKENLVLISFKEDLSYRKINEESLIKEYKFKKEDFIEVDIPCTEPISNEQYVKNNKIWPLCNYISTKEKYIYEHNKIEEKEILDIFNNYLLSENKEIDSLLYDPMKKVVVAETKNNENVISGHSIMSLLEMFSQNLIDKNNVNKHNNKEELKLGKKKLVGPEDNNNLLYGENNDNTQYYCERLYVFTKKEPCLMCCMALIHNRIARLFFNEIDQNEGALISKYSLDNYNLNHHYLVFKLK